MRFGALILLLASCSTEDLSEPTVPSRYEACTSQANQREGGFNEEWFAVCLRGPGPRPDDGGAPR